MKSRDGKSQRRGEEERRSKRESLQRKKIQVREKVGKSRNTVFFQWFVAPEGRKVGSLKRRVRSQLARCEMKNCTPLWREAHFEVKMYKTHHARSTFGSWDVEKAHAFVARSTFRIQKCKKLTGLEHFWKLRCRKSARRCGAKHISTTTTLQPQLRLTTTLHTTPHHTTSSKCGCNHCNRSKKPQLQPPFGPSVGSLCHPCITRTHLSYSVLFLYIFVASATALCGTGMYWHARTHTYI